MAFSIIIITLNEQDYISTILNDLLLQTYKDFEVILVDADSTDKTLEVVENYKSKLDLTAVIAKTKGPSAQRNYGVTLAKYENIIFFDADVHINPNFLESFNQQLDHYVLATTWHVGDSKKFIYKPMAILATAYLELMKNIKPVASGSFIFIKKSLFNKLQGFDEALFYGEDTDFVRRYSKLAKFKVFHKPIVHFSPRRFEKNGILRTFLKYLKLNLKLAHQAPEKVQKKSHYEFGEFSKD